MTAPTAAAVVRRAVMCLWAATIFERSQTAGIENARDENRARWVVLVTEAHDLAERASREAEMGYVDSARSLADVGRRLLDEARQVRTT